MKSMALGIMLAAGVMDLVLCGHVTPARAQQLACDDGIKAAFRPDSHTSVVAVRLVKKGEKLVGA